MKREILFRGKAKNGTWSQGFLIENQGRTFICQGHPENLYYVEVNQETIGQYIGLSDINGNKIFDGDILDSMTGKYSNNGYSFICKWEGADPYLFYQGMCYGPGETNNWMNKYPLTEKNVCDLRIVGNIYDNPEMVKKQNGDS